jgi:hypothetical protein
MAIHGFKISMEVNKLLGLLKDNREKHTKEFTEAVTAYRGKVTKALRKRADDIERGAKTDPSKFLNFNLPSPKSYTDDYTEVIDMLEMCEDDLVELDHEQFKNWVKDDWNWKDRFLALNSSYIND